MKTEEMLILAGAALFAWWLVKGRTPEGSVSIGAPETLGGALSDSLSDFASGIYNAAKPGQPGFGWQYFSDGVAIDPKGNYYLNGQMVWKNTA